MLIIRRKNLGVLGMLLAVDEQISSVIRETEKNIKQGIDK